jgi:hypothetical protein
MRLAHANETRGKRSKRVNHAIKPGRPVLAGTGAASRHRPRAVRLLRPDSAGKTGTVPRTPGVIPIGVDTAWYARRVGVGSEPASEVAAPEIKRLDWRRLLAWRCFIAGGQNRPERPWQQKRENAKAPRNAKRLCLRQRHRVGAGVLSVSTWPPMYPHARNLGVSWRLGVSTFLSVTRDGGWSMITLSGQRFNALSAYQRNARETFKACKSCDQTMR